MPSAKQEKTIENVEWYVNCDTKLNSFTLGEEFPEVNPASGRFGPNINIKAALRSNNKSKRFKSRWTLTKGEANSRISDGTKLKYEETDEEGHKEGRGKDAAWIERYFANTLEGVKDVSADTYRVICTKVNSFKKNREILEANIETWRRLWFSIYWTDDSHVPVLQPLAEAIRDEFQRAKINFVSVPGRRLNWPHQEYAIVNTNFHNLRGGDPIIYGRAMHGGAYPELKRKPFHLQIVLTKGTCGIYRNQVDFQLKRSSDTGIAAQYYWQHGGGFDFVIPGGLGEIPTDDLITQMIRAETALITFAHLIKLDAVTIGDSRFEIVSPVPIVRNDPESFGISSPVGNGTTDRILDLARSSNDLGDQKVTFHFTLHTSRGIAGDSAGNKIMVSTEASVGGRRSPLTQGLLNSTVVHEIGHAVGLVPTSPMPESGENWQHGNAYSGKGGVGNHCSHNASEVDGQYVPDGQTCVMFHRLHENSGTQFCDNCLKALRFVGLRSADLISKNWNMFTS